MGIIQNLLGRTNDIDADYYTQDDVSKRFNQAELDTIQKSLPKGKARLAPAVSGLDVSTSGYSQLDKTNVLETKKMLRRSANNIIVQAIIRTRVNQVQQFARPSRYSADGVGFKITPKDAPKDGTLTSQQKNKIKEYEDFIMNSGVEWTPQRSNSFKNFIASFIYNYFVYDQINVELIRNGGKLNHYNFVDAGTVTLDKVYKHAEDPRTFKQYPDSASEKPVTLHEKDLTFVTYSNFSDTTRAGYGYSNVEATLDHLRYQNYTEQFNARFFSQGGTTRGILLIDTGATASQNTAALNSLRRQWQSSGSGINGSWKIPLISASDAKFVNMTQSSKDMEFSDWLTYLINVICSNFQIQPDEINFPNRGGSTSRGSGNSINEGSTQKAKFQQSREKGLRSLLDNIEDFINEYLLREIAPDYVFHFTLGDAKDALEQENIRGQKLKNGMTLNESRKEMGFPPLKNDLGDFPGDAATGVQYAQLIHATDKVAQYAQQHKNDIDPDKANHGQPDKAMPASAVNDNKDHADTMDDTEKQNNQE
ncbi:phage portal protein [Secundilactobacillus kimchicus]|uniref:phage portal protein n=1 Tax=Secundilactobacillus kimchicus TaxID=528209 RepID=UPI001C00C881|nr:phage portal protein [Secundilactobacillus kimchicus]MBT9670593.1 phage portal protein [Secundilactobacillus kimchicus]